MDACKSPSPHPHNTTVLITHVYEGIPETLTLNVIAWLLLLLLFTALRKSAWNYGRLALVQDDSSAGWTRLLYGETIVDPEPEVTARRLWPLAVLTLSDERIRRRCGPDAAHYLSFQRHLIAFACVIVALSLCVVLPINFGGRLEGDSKTFGHTTIANLEPDSPWLWVHAFVAFAYLPIAVLIMRRSSGRKPPPDYATRTLMLGNIPRADRDARSIEERLRRRFPDVNVLDVQLAYDTKELSEIDDEREMARRARQYAENHSRKSGETILLRRTLCSEKEDAISYYTGREKKYSDMFERRKAITLSDPLDIAFATLSSRTEVERVLLEIQSDPRCPWTAENAPAPTDIFWENLHIESGIRCVKTFFLNLCLFVILFFLTTPAIMVSAIDFLHVTSEDGIVARISPVVSEFLPTLLLWTMAAVLPIVVAYSDRLLSHRTRSELTYSIMVKTFFFLLAMTLVLPSLGLTSAQAFVEWTLQRENGTYRWQCIFLPDKGAFFVNYVITSAFIGTALELIRFGELCVFVCYMLRTKSQAENAYVQKAVLDEFPFGVHYAWTLVVFTIMVVYSVPCPLIAPFGLVYLLLKHFGDRHNIYFAYKASDMSGVYGGNIHSTAVRMVRVAVLLLQVCLAALAWVRGGVDPRTIVLFLFMLATLGTLLMLSPFPSCEPPQPTREGQVQSKYIAPVFLKPSQNSTMRNVHDYGSSDVGEPNHEAINAFVNI